MNNIITEIEKNNLTKQYESLINKITKQFTDKGCGNWEDVKSMAYEGFAIAINTYDPEKSSMTFMQFAGFAIRNNILTGLNNELRTVKLSAYAQKKATENGESLFNSISIDIINNASNSESVNIGPKKSEWVRHLSEEAKFDDGDVFDTLYSKLEDKFNKRDCEIFYRTFGLNGFDEDKGKDIAKMYGISKSLVSIKVNSIIKFIRNDEELIEILSNLLK